MRRLRHHWATCFNCRRELCFLLIVSLICSPLRLPLETSSSAYAAGSAKGNVQRSDLGFTREGKADESSMSLSYQSPLFRGSGSYTLPIEILAGVDGMQPALSLSYSSKHSNDVYVPSFLATPYR